jgi:hypothetical protein
MVKVVKKRVRKGKPTESASQRGKLGNQTVNVSVRIGGGKKAGNLPKGRKDTDNKKIDKPQVDIGLGSATTFGTPYSAHSSIHPIYYQSPLVGLGVSRTAPMEQLTPSSKVIGQPEPNLHNAEQNLPSVIAYPLPPLLPVSREPAIIKQKSGKYIPKKQEIYTSPNPNEVGSYDESIRDFQETRSRNELIKDNNTPYNTIPSEQQDIRDNYNLNLNSGASEYDDIPPSETPALEEELTQGPYPYGQPIFGSVERRARGRPYSKITDDDIKILEDYLRIATSIKPRNRTLQQQQQFSEGQRIISNKRNNPNLKPIIDGIKARLEDEKK